jgi:RNA polymerase sigma-70 factor (ECF subfamily)
MGLISRIVADRAEAEDLWQETWFSIWHAGHVEGKDRDLWPLIRRTAVTRIIDHFRASARRPKLVTGDEVEPMTVRKTSAPELDLSSLTKEQRAVLVLHFWEGLSVKEIATELLVPTNTVKTWMHRGRSQLRSHLLQRREVL